MPDALPLHRFCLLRFLPLLVASLFLPGLASAFPEAHYFERGSGSGMLRQWQSAEGASLWAKLHYADDDLVIIETPEGFRAIPLHRLSQEDLNFLKDWRRDPHDGYHKYRRGIFLGKDLPPSAAVPSRAHPVLEGHAAAATTSWFLEYFGRREAPETLLQMAARNEQGPHFWGWMRLLRNFGLPTLALDLHRRNTMVSPSDNLLHGVREAISEGKPVWLRLEIGGYSLYMVATGYDDGARSFTVVSPREDRTSLSYAEFSAHAQTALVPFPRPHLERTAPVAAPAREFLQQVSAGIRANEQLLHTALALELSERGLAAQGRNANRFDAETVGQQTRAFARAHGDTILRVILNRGAVAIIPQGPEAGARWLLIHGLEGSQYRCVLYRSPTGFEHRLMSAQEIAAVWMLTRRGRDGEGPARYSLPLVEVEP